MSRLLAVEPDSKQSAILKDIARRQPGVALVIVRSKDEAVAAIRERLPDLILMSALVPPRDEAELNDHLRGVAGAEHVQTVSIPLLAHSAPKRATDGRFDTFRRKGAKKKTSAACGCDPSIFGAEIAAYLKQAADRRPAPQADEEITPAIGPAPLLTTEASAPVPLLAATCDVEDVPGGIEEATSVAVVEETATPVVDEEAAPPIPLLEATCRIEHPPAIVDEIFRAMVEETPLPLACLAGVLAPVGVPEDVRVESAPAIRRNGVEAFFSDWRGADPKGPRRGPLPPVSSSHAERLELWHSLPLLIHVAPSLQGPEVRERPIVGAPVAEHDVEAPQLLGATTIASPPPAVPEPVEPAPAVVATSVPDEWGFYNPSSCGFEALFEKLESLDRVEKRRNPSPSPVERPKRNKKQDKADSRPDARSEAPDRRADSPVPVAARWTVTDEILQSLRLPPSIAALGRPTGCRIRTRKRKPRRRFPPDRRLPEPLIIVSKRMLELG
ncbi:MAG: hypothetical protein HYZ58_07780 [Acidobacteria bacterium]|nr:hypothetical protein [Acidobacteriota bacterium]